MHKNPNCEYLPQNWILIAGTVQIDKTPIQNHIVELFHCAVMRGSRIEYFCAHAQRIEIYIFRLLLKW
jgi:hypothetical protein